MAKLWLISQTVVQDYDTFDSAVVVAETEDDAKNTHPYGRPLYDPCDTWPSSPVYITVEYLGETELEVGRVVCASFNAG